MIYENYEASISGLDIFPCPICNTKEYTTIYSEENHKRIACSNCNYEESSFIEWIAVAKWNWQYINKLSENEYSQKELYETIYNEALYTEKANEYRIKRELILEKEILQKCPLKINDIIEFVHRIGNYYEVASIEAIWAYNTGPIWIAKIDLLDKARNKTGKEKEIYSNSNEQYTINSVFVFVHRWNQLHINMLCLVGNHKGKIISVDQKLKQAKVKLDQNKEIAINKLNSLKVRLNDLISYRYFTKDN